jgi:tRNA-dihydrouridine synthase B
MRIGSIQIERGLLLAPMEDVTDLPFRLLCKRLGADIVYTEFVKTEELVRDIRSVRRKLRFDASERPLGIQLYGGDPGTMAEAARRAEALGPDLIDLNCGCWVKDVTRHGAGAALLRDLGRLEEVLTTVVNAVRIPVTLKTRLGWDASSIRIVDVARLAERVGIRAITVHCRTRDQGHAGPVDYSWIPQIKAAVSIPVIVNGDITTPETARRVFETTGCDAVMIGRAAVRNPWIFQQTRTYLETGVVPPPPGPEERIALFREHLALAAEHLGERDAVYELRRHYAIVLTGMPHVNEVRDALRRAESPGQILEHLERFCDLYSVPA